MSDKEHLNIPPEFSEDRPIIERYNDMLSRQSEIFFDVNEFETIIDFYLTTYDMQVASEAIERGLRQHPHSFELKIKRAQVLLNQGYAGEALQQVSALELVEPNNSELMSLRGDIYSYQREYDKAITWYLKAMDMVHVEVNPNLVLSLALTYLDNGNELDGISRLVEVIRLDPHNDFALEKLRISYQKADLESEGIWQFHQHCKANPNRFEGWFQLGLLCSDNHRYADSLLYIEKALAIKADHPESLLGKAEVLYQLDDYTQSIETYMSIRNAEELYATICCGVAECYEQLEDYEKALKYYKDCLTLEPDHAEAHIGSAIVLDLIGRSEAALAYLRTALELEPENYEFWHIQGEMLGKMGQTQRALFAFEQSLKFDQKDENVYSGYIDTLMVDGQKDKALEIVEYAFEKIGNVESIYHRGVRVLLDMKKSSEAEQLLLIMLREFPLSDLTLLQQYPDLAENVSIFDIIKTHQKTR